MRLPKLFFNPSPSQRFPTAKLLLSKDFRRTVTRGLLELALSRGVRSAAYYRPAGQGGDDFLLAGSFSRTSPRRIPPAKLPFALLESLCSRSEPGDFLSLNPGLPGSHSSLRDKGLGVLLAELIQAGFTALIASRQEDPACRHSPINKGLTSVVLLGAEGQSRRWSAADRADCAADALRLAALVSRAIEAGGVKAEIESSGQEHEKIFAEKERLIDRLHETEARLERYQKEKPRELLSGIGRAVAHEITNPLTLVLPNVQMALHSLEELFTKQMETDGAARRDALKAGEEKFLGIRRKLLMAASGAVRIRGITDTLRDLVKSRTGEKKPVQLKLIITCAWEEFRFQGFENTLTQPELCLKGISCDLPLLRGVSHDLQGVFASLFKAAAAVHPENSARRISLTAKVCPERLGSVTVEFACTSLQGEQPPSRQSSAAVNTSSLEFMSPEPSEIADVRNVIESALEGSFLYERFPAAPADFRCVLRLPCAAQDEVPPL